MQDEPSRSERLLNLLAMLVDSRRGVTLEVLRAFLTSVLVPATRARTWSESFKARFEQFTKTRPDAAQNSNGNS